jgi:S-adenosylmethionine-diacylgycerolhomoserine-N-methlytransferase
VTTDAKLAHQQFLDRYYGSVKHLYDLTRKYYLFGRDTALKGLLAEPWSSLVEIGPGTGRNLKILRQARPDARYGGVDASEEMLGMARRRCPWATLVQGFAEDADLAAVLGERPDVVLFSYCLSMVQQPEAALENARRAVGLHGQVVVVDFADLAGVWGPARGPLQRFLRAFHVEPLDEALFAPLAPRVEFGPLRYYAIARIAGS